MSWASREAGACVRKGRKVRKEEHVKTLRLLRPLRTERSCLFVAGGGS